MKCLVIPIAFCFLRTLIAQEPPPPTIKANVRQVLVPVIVTDKSGHYVADLERGDFNVFEDGVPQPIVAFSRSAVTTAVTGSAAQQSGRTEPIAPEPGQNDSPKRTYLICLDTLHSAFSGFVQTRKALEKFFAQEQAGASQYALIALGRELHVVVDSTREPATILAALGSKDLQKTIQDSEAANIASESEQFLRLMGAYCANCACGSSDKDGPRCPVFKSQVRSALITFGERTAGINQNFLQQLGRLVSAIATMPTKHTVLFVSDGFNRYAGEEFNSIMRAFEPRDRSFEFNPRDLQPQLEGVLKLAVRYDVRFYTLDSRGLYTAANVPGTGMSASSAGAPEAVSQGMMTTAWFNGDAMAQLARETGGVFFENTNDLLKGIRRAFADGREEYVLAYTPTNSVQDGRFRRITINLKDKKLRVAAKSGYWAAP